MTSSNKFTTEERLRRECLRLSRRLAEERSNNESLRQATSATLSSITFRLAAAANALLARVLGMGKGPTAWDQLKALVETPTIHRDQADSIELSDHQLLHAEASCSEAGLTRLDQGARTAQLLVIGSEPPFELQVPYTRVAATDDFSQLTDFWGVLAVAGRADNAMLLEVAQATANAQDLPLAIWSDSVLPEPPMEALVAGPNAADSPDANRISNPMAFHRWLGQLYANSLHRGQVPFTETAYLRSNPDIAQAISEGDFASAAEHWEMIGKLEFANGSRGCHLRRDEPNVGLQEATPELCAQAAAEWETWSHQPKISVLVPVYRVDLQWLKACVDSVTSQIYPFWQLCLVDDASEIEEISTYLSGLDDPRINVQMLDKNVGISAASNAALTLADGDYIALLDHDDTLTVDALWLNARVIQRYQPDIIYSDEAKLDEHQQVVEPHFKPDFSWPQLLSQNYVSHLGVYRRDLVDSVGGFRTGYEGSQDHDLLLRVAQVSQQVFHITRVLYYWRKVPGSTAQRFGDKDYAWDRGVQAVSDALQGGGDASKGPYPGTYQTPIPRNLQESVTLLVPFRDQPEVLETCLRSVTEKTAYQQYKLIGLNNQSQKRKTFELMQEWSDHDRVSFVDFDQPFNFSAINNFGAQQTDADHLLLLNNDIEVLEADWLEAMLMHSTKPDVGAVGALLLYPDQTIQHAGVILGIGGVAGHSHKYIPESHHGYFCRPHLDQNVSAVTGACLMVKRKLYLKVGGLDDENLAVAFNDIDFCLRLRELGYQNVYTPRSRLIHHESKSRGVEDTPEKQRRFNREAAYMRRRHALALCLGDPFYNPSLSMVTEDFSLRPEVQQLMVS